MPVIPRVQPSGVDIPHVVLSQSQQSSVGGGAGGGEGGGGIAEQTDNIHSLCTLVSKERKKLQVDPAENLEENKPKKCENEN